MAKNDERQSYGSPTTVISAVGTVADGEVVGGQTELDNSSALFPFARCVLLIPSTFGATPAGPISLYMVRGEVDGSTDGTALGYAALTTASNQTSPEYAEFMGAFNPDVDEAYVDSINISLMGAQKAKFYIFNETGTTLVDSASDIALKITPFTRQPTP